jgi:branched-subunit amino acid aminotransferase/4-amino-4-deoxychorismate lyase
MAGQSRARIDGEGTSLATASLNLGDAGVARGDGAFETVGVWGGRPFRLEDHLQRLQASLTALALPPAPVEALREDCAALLTDVVGDAALRIYLTASGTRVLTLADLPDRPPTQVLVPLPGPWIQPVGAYGPAGAKTMSYCANMTATRLAVRAGGDDALLCSVPDGLVLEGPTFGVAFFAGGVMHAPAPDLGIIDSISRRTVLDVAREQGVEVVLGRWPLAELASADEVIICSSLRPVAGVARVGEHRFAPNRPLAPHLDEGVQALRRTSG